jgi:hypothetical protein
MRKSLILVPLILSSLAFGYEQIIPVVAKAGGAYGSTWQSDLTVLNAGRSAVDLTLTYQPAGHAGNAMVRTAAVQPGAVFSQADILGWFGVQGSGSLTLGHDDGARTAIGVTSRTYTTGEAGSFGQSVPAVPADQAVSAGAELFLVLPADPAKERFNFGIAVLEDAQVAWQLLGPDGGVLAQVDKSYPAGMQEQYNGPDAFFGAAGGSLVKAVLSEGKVVVYGSRVDNGTNDGSFVLAPKLQSNQAPRFLGVDASSNGSLDYSDADGDNVLETPIPFSTSFLFNFLFTVVAQDAEGDPLTFRLVNPPAGMTLTDEHAGSIYYAPSKQDVNKTIQLKVEISDGFTATVATIPMQITP